jgi:hypothetical protein
LPLGAQSPGRPDSQAGEEPPLLHEFNSLRDIPVGADTQAILDQPRIAAEVKREVGATMAEIFGSYAFRQAVIRAAGTQS